MAKTTSNGWKISILDYGVKPADQFTPHPDNARLHPEYQRAAVKASIARIGFIAPVVESALSGYVIDGHERVWEGLEHNPPAPIPFVRVEFASEEDEHFALATFDPITNMATYDRQKFADLLHKFNSDSPSIQQMISNLAISRGVVEGFDPNAEWVGMPEYAMDDKTAFRSLHVHFKSQEDIDSFAELIGQDIGGMRSIWYPEAEKTDMYTELYVDES